MALVIDWKKKIFPIMEIRYFGHSFFRLKGKEITLATNPFDASLGLKVSPQTADIVLFSSPAKTELRKIINKPVSRDETFVIDNPGEYEVGDVFILGFSEGKTTFYVVTIDDLRLVFLGGLSKKLSDKQIEEVDGIDVLFLPVGDREKLLAPKQAVEIINQVEPKIIIPMSYQIPSLKLDLATLDSFLKEVEQEQKFPLDKLLVTKDKLPLEKEVVVLNARS